MEHAIPVLLVILLSSLIQSTFSFGGALIALPLLSFFIDIKVATPLMTMLSASIALFIVIKHRKEIDVRAVWRLVVSALFGIPIGIFFLKYFNERILKSALAVTVIAFTVLNLFRIRKKGEIAINSAFLFGFLSGIFGGAYNISGPPVVLFGTLADWPPALFRTTLQSFSLVTNSFSIAGHLIAGNITKDVLGYYVLALPVAVFSVYIGHLLNKKIPAGKYAVIVKVMLLVLGINLLISAFF